MILFSLFKTQSFYAKEQILKNEHVHKLCKQTVPVQPILYLIETIATVHWEMHCHNFSHNLKSL